MNDFEVSVQKGHEGEEAFISAMMDMGHTPIVTTISADLREKADAILACVEECREGHEAKRRVSVRVIDVKSASGIPSRNRLDHGALLVEWRNERSMEATSFSDESGSVTHLAYMIETGQYWKRPFYLVSITHFRQFFIEHNIRGDEAIRPAGWKWPHCALLNMEQFLREYSLFYYSYGGGQWRRERIGNESADMDETYFTGEGTEEECPEIWEMSRKIMRWQRCLWEKHAGGMKEGELLAMCKQSADAALVNEFERLHSADRRKETGNEFVPYWEK